MRNITIPMIVGVTALCCSSAALAWGGDVSQSREIYRDTISVRTPTGQIGHAIVVFTVSATAYVGQDGNAKWPDDRACYYNDVRRTLVRSLTFTGPDGTQIPVRDTTLALPNIGGYHWSSVTTCNDKIGDINNRLVGAIGDVTSWQRYIDGDKADVNKIIAQFGQVT